MEVDVFAWTVVKPAWVVIGAEIDGHTRCHSYAIVLTWRHCPVCVFTGAV